MAEKPSVVSEISAVAESVERPAPAVPAREGAE